MPKRTHNAQTMDPGDPDLNLLALIACVASVSSFANLAMVAGVPPAARHPLGSHSYVRLLDMFERNYFGVSARSRIALNRAWTV